MENRKREVQIIVRVTEQERQLISEKMKQLPTQNLSAYARKMLIDRYIILLDTKEIKAHAAQLQKIGGNINQIARRQKCNKRLIPTSRTKQILIAFLRWFVSMWVLRN